MKTTLALFVSLLTAAAATAGGDAAPHPAPPPVPKAVRALGAAKSIEHFPVKGDSGPTSWSTGPYSYDPAGNVTVIGSQYFVYDTNSRLTTASISSGTASVQQTFTYDPYGNLTNIQFGTTTSTPINVSDGTNHLSGTGIAYDDAGNLKAWTDGGDTFTYAYDGGNMMQQVTEQFNFNNILYVYTADDQRIWTFDIPTGISRWKIRDLEGKVLREFVQSSTGWSVPKDYFYRNDLLLAAVAPSSGATEHFSLDHLGTPRLITNQNAVKIGFHVYLPYGQEMLVAGLLESPPEVMKFTGHERDPDLSGNGDVLDYMHARYYNTPIGRFQSIDPEGGRTEDPQSLNKYAYSRDNPMRYVDPDGQLWVATGDPNNPFGWQDTDECTGTQKCYETVATIQNGQLVIYGSQGPTDIKRYTPNSDGYISLATIAQHPDADFSLKSGIRGQYMSLQSAKDFYNTLAEHQQEYPDNDKVVVTDAGTANGSALSPHKTHDLGRAVDIRYQNGEGHNLQGDSAAARADQRATRDLVTKAKQNNFKQNYSARPNDFGTSYAKHHENHLHIGKTKPPEPKK